MRNARAKEQADWTTQASREHRRRPEDERLRQVMRDIASELKVGSALFSKHLRARITAWPENFSMLVFLKTPRRGPL